MALLSSLNGLTDKWEKLSCMLLIASCIVLLYAHDHYVVREPQADDDYDSLGLETVTKRSLLASTILSGAGFMMAFNILSATSYRMLLYGAYWRTHLSTIMLFVTFVSSIIMLETGCWVYFCPFKYQKQVILPEAVVGIVCAIISIILLRYFPVPLLENSLVGDYQVGTICTNINVESEDGASKSAYIACQCWYPKDPSLATSSGGIAEILSSLVSNNSQLWTSGDPEFSNDESWYLTKHLAGLYKLPHFLLKHLILARTNAKWSRILEIDLKKKYPVIIYSHGLYGWRQCGQITCEMLASFGFIVLALDHSPDCTSNRLYAKVPEESFFSFDFFVSKEASPSEDRQHYQKGAIRRLNQIDSLLNIISSPNLKYILESGRSSIKTDREQDERKMLTSFVDLDNLFIMGHSYGGMTAALAASRANSRDADQTSSQLETKFKGLVLLDAWMYPCPDADRLRGAPSCSILSLSSHLWPFAKFQTPFRMEFMRNSKNNSAVKDSGLENRNEPHSWTEGAKYFDFFVRDSNHQNFADVHRLVSPEVFYAAYPKPPGKPSTIGPVDPIKQSLLIDSMVLNFFLKLTNTGSSPSARLDNPLLDISKDKNSSDADPSTSSTNGARSVSGSTEEFLKYISSNDSSSRSQLIRESRGAIIENDDVDGKQCFDDTYFLKVKSGEIQGMV